MNEGRNIFVCGRTGTGKSYLLHRLLDRETRLVVYLPKREEVTWRAIYFDALQPDEAVQFWQFWGRCVLGRAEWLTQCRRFRLVYQPRDAFSAEEFERLCLSVYLCGNLTFVAEDLMGYCGTVAQLGSGFKTLLTAGRTKGVTCYMVTQRPYRIPREVTSQAREAFIFQSHEPADVDYVKDAFGIEAAERMAALGQYEYVHWIDSGQVEVGNA